MVRKQIYITKAQEQFLKSQSSQGIKEAEIIRRALDEYMKNAKDS